MHEFMTTKEVADYLRIKERRVYELVRQKAIPCTRVTGKWLFPRRLIDLWLNRNAEGELTAAAAPAVVAGSHDPLLEWAVRESGCGLALLTGGSLDGLERFARGEAGLAGLHLYEPESDEFNLPAIRASLPTNGLVLIEWTWRQQGLVLAPGNPKAVRGLADLADKKLVVMARQAAAGAQLLFAHLLEGAGIDPDDLTYAEETARSETDLGLGVLEGRADAGLAVEAVARSLKLDFVPLKRERYDLLLRRRDYFEPPTQRLLAFCRSAAFAQRADALGGYDTASLGQVWLNGE